MKGAQTTDEEEDKMDGQSPFSFVVGTFAEVLGPTQQQRHCLVLFRPKRKTQLSCRA